MTSPPAPPEVTELARVTAERDELRELINAHQPTLASQVLQLRRELESVGRGGIAILKERDELRALVTEVLDDLEHVVNGNAGYIDRDMLEDYRERAGLEPQS